MSVCTYVHTYYMNMSMYGLTHTLWTDQNVEQHVLHGGLKITHKISLGAFSVFTGAGSPKPEYKLFTTNDLN